MPGIIQNILEKNIAINPDIEVVGVVSGGLSVISALKESQVDLLMIGSDIPKNEVLEMINVMQDHYPDIYCLVLRETSREVREIIKVGAHQALRGLDLEHKLDDLLEDIRARIS